MNLQSSRRPTSGRPSIVMSPLPGWPGRGIPWELLLLLLMLFPFGPAAPAANLFVKVENPGWTPIPQWQCLPIWGDYDGDGWIDLLLNTQPLAVQTRVSNRLYRNNRDGTFTLKLAAEVGPLVNDIPLPNAIAGSRFWVDVNNDGFVDLLLLSGTEGGLAIPGRLYLNDGSGRFSSVEAGALTQTRLRFDANSGCVSDYDNDGWLDVFLAGAWGRPDATQNLLFHGRGDGAFERVTDNSIARDEMHLGVLHGTWVDIDDDGDQDLIVRGGGEEEPKNAVYRNEGHGVFTRLTGHFLENVESYGGFGAWGDFDNDGDLDGLSWRGLAVNNGRWDFQRSERDLPADTDGLTPAWVDIDNDGHLDVMMTDSVRGVVLSRNRGQGTFEPIEDPLPGFTMGNGGYTETAWGDYDNDGDMDVFVHVADSSRWLLFRNESKINHWLKLQLTGTAANRSAIGARVRVKVTIGGQTLRQLRDVDPAASGRFNSDLRPNFGLGDATVAEEVRIEWPSGNVTVLTNVAANRILDVTEVVNIEPARPVTVINGSVSLTHTLAASSRQWYSEAGALAGQTGQVLTLTSVQPSQAGRYSVVAQTDTGSQTNHVYLRVLSPALTATRVAEGVRIECRGDPATAYALESSASVRGSWTKQQTLNTDAAGVATATVPIEAGSRFFQVVKE